MNNEHLAKLAKILKDFCDGKLELEPADRQDLILCLWELELIVGEDIPPEISIAGEDFLNLGIPPNIGKLSSENLVILEELLGKIKLKKTGKKETNEEDSEEDNKTRAEYIIDVIFSSAEFFKNQHNEAFAIISSNNHKEMHPIRSRFFKQWVSYHVYRDAGFVPSNEPISIAMNIIEARAFFDGEQHTLLNRVARREGSIFYDLTDEKWEAIRISKEGWEIVEPPILFRRYSHQKAQTYPDKTAKIDDIKLLKKYISLSEQDFQLLLVHITTFLIQGIPHPIPVFYGSQGSSKSTAMRFIKRLFDPSSAELLIPSTDKTEFVQQLAHHYLPFYDNISSLSEWHSDMLCVAATGGSFSKRELYSDDSDVIYSFAHCPGLNGINIAAQKPDLLDRSILYELKRISRKDRKKEEELYSEFEKDRPRIFGAILSAVSKAMEIKEKIKVSNPPRMADFAEWGESISQAYGYDAGSFLKLYDANLKSQNKEAVKGHVIGEILLKFVENLPNEKEQKHWEGKASTLLKEITEIAENEFKLNIKTIKKFPKAPHVLTRRLNELKTNLNEEGILIDVTHEADGNTITITTDNSNIASEASVSSKTDLNPENQQNLAKQDKEAMSSEASKNSGELGESESNEDTEGILSSSFPTVLEPENDNEKKVFAVIDFLVNDRKEAEQSEIEKICSEDYGFSSEITIATISELLSRKRIFEARSYQNEGGQTVKIYNIVK